MPSIGVIGDQIPPLMRLSEAQSTRYTLRHCRSIDLMRASAWRALRAVSKKQYPKSCRFVAGRRCPHSKQRFHTSPSLRRDDDPAEPAWNTVQEPPNELARPQETPIEADGLVYSPEGAPENPRPKDRSNYGSASRRAGRNIRKVKELPPVHIPPWFLERNVRLRESQAHVRWDNSPENRNGDKNDSNPASSVPPSTANSLAERGSGNGSEDIRSSANHSRETTGMGRKGSNNIGDATLETTIFVDEEARTAPFQLDASNMREIFSMVSAGLQVPQWQRAELTASPKPHLVLFCPKDGTSYFLERLGRALAAQNGTDFVRLNAQDIAEIGGDYIDNASDFRASTLSSLGYDAPLVAGTRYQHNSDEDAEDDDFDEPDEEEMETETDHNRGRPVQVGHGPRFGAIHVSPFPGGIQDVLKSLIPAAGPQLGKPLLMQPVQQPKDITPDLKMGLLVETLLNAVEVKRVTQKSVPDSSAEQEPAGSTENPNVIPNEPQVSPTISLSSPSTERGSEGLVVLVQDYPQINSTVNGAKFLDKLHEVVDMRRKEGQKVLIIGTASSKELTPSFSRSGINEVQNEPRDGPTRTIVTPILEVGPGYDTFAQEHKRKMEETNLRHIRDMLRRTAPNYAQVAPVVMDWKLEIDSKSSFLSGLGESIWSMDKTNRVATTALGLLDDSKEMTSKHIEQALELIESSDNAKAKWVTKEKEQPKKRKTEQPRPTIDEESKERMRKLRKTCNSHEKKLLNGVVNAEAIRTSFADVHAPPSTIDALKTLTSLSLVRPDAFKYGVLATDRIPGLLLYGPPGTGKTLLAKAVAKESGATVLEVSGSDIYDMYVGEGEKNVKAVFSLAKKLTPCIVFIDEADAILGARSGNSNRTSHRELINQFLREWDGMTETNAFIMVATNRPFDLDEACLRRLPRRLLVDLPVEKDREAILKIHLKDEVLDPEVSLLQLAAQTPFYSGSDLKNLAVAAALACVREEFDAAAAHNQGASDGEKYQYPEKRTLYQRHFNKAMEEISASISEDMGSLSAIRKFDEKYGDRRGRRKKGGYGFKTSGESDKQGSDSARVRNQT